MSSKRPDDPGAALPPADDAAAEDLSAIVQQDEDLSAIVQQDDAASAQPGGAGSQGEAERLAQEERERIVWEERERYLRERREAEQKERAAGAPDGPAYAVGEPPPRDDADAAGAAGQGAPVASRQGAEPDAVDWSRGPVAVAAETRAPAEAPGAAAGEAPAAAAAAGAPLAAAEPAVEGAPTAKVDPGDPFAAVVAGPVKKKVEIKEKVEWPELTPIREQPAPEPPPAPKVEPPPPPPPAPPRPRRPSLVARLLGAVRAWTAGLRGGGAERPPAPAPERAGANAAQARREAEAHEREAQAREREAAERGAAEREAAAREAAEREAAEREAAAREAAAREAAAREAAAREAAARVRADEEAAAAAQRARSEQERAAERERAERTRAAAPGAAPVHAVSGAAADAAVPVPPPAPLPEPPSLEEFEPFARVLRVPVPSDPAPLAAEEEAGDAALAAEIVAHFGSTRAEQASFPAIALQILDLAAHPDAEVAKLAALISRDPVLSAGVISVANSPVYRGVQEVETVRDAVTRLGLSEVSRVAAAVSARALFNPQVRAERVVFGQRARDLFVLSVAIGGAATTAAMRQRGARTDRVYLGGLLHDVGKALALRALARVLLDAGRADPEAARVERVLDRVHLEIGSAAHQAWALPQPIVAICARHHEPVIAAGPEVIDLHLVRVASALASLRHPVTAARAAREIVQSAGALGLDPFAVRAIDAELRDAEKRAAALPR